VQTRLPKGKKLLGPEARPWIAYPKAKKQVTDLNRDILGAVIQEYGFQAIRVASIDEIWSAMWFKLP